MRTSSAAWLTATEALDAIRSGELSPAEVVATHLERVRHLNPALAAYVHVDERATAGQGPLAGVTLAVKDTQPVRGMPWTCGSRRVGWPRLTASPWREPPRTESPLPARPTRPNWPPRWGPATTRS